MKKVILVRCGEIMLKGLNRPAFENKLVSNIKRAVRECGKSIVFKSQARIYVEPINDDFDFELAFKKISKVFGVVSLSPVWKIPSDIESIKENALIMISNTINSEDKKTFKVQTRRGDKRFPMGSMELSSEIGAYFLSKFSNLTVDVHNPNFIFYIEVREFTYMYFEILPANGGMPTGTNGKATLLLSGGIDSPVAGWMIAKRGVCIEAVHFYSYPYTSERSKEKVISLAKIMTEYCGKIRLHIVPFTDIQLKINEKCHPELLVIIMRRAMMKISEIIADKSESLALVTGESIGQVASQTIQSLYATDDAVKIPVFRPLIGMDKNEVIKLAQKIGTFETSILPYEDCCTVFVPKHPKTKPVLKQVIEEEKKAELETMINEAIINTEIMVLEVQD
jgi:thiamine biosynthesis protein ThiI